MAFKVFTLKERPDLRSGIFAAAFQPPFLPEFMVHDPAGWYFSMPFFGPYLEFALAATDQRKSARALVCLVDQPHGSTPSRAR